jgi:hypothetical protein
MMGIGYVVFNRGPRNTYRSVQHFPQYQYKQSVEYESRGPAVIHGYRCGFHIFKNAEDARAAAELGTSVICKVSYRNIFNYGHVKLGGCINLQTGDVIQEYMAPVVVTRYRTILKEVE